MTNKDHTEENDYIIIPNPIYDVVFRYLMEDSESATIVLSTLLNIKIKKLHLEPLTHSEKKQKKERLQVKDPITKDDIHLFHLDFTATIEKPDHSEELVMIELQKASEPSDIFRFKRYISKNFRRKHKKEIIDPQGGSVKIVDRPIRLIPIFILNFRIENEINDLLIRTNRIKMGVFKNKQLESENEFIDNLSFDLWVVQLPNLPKIRKEEYEKDKYKSKLYALLKIFDQASKVKSNEHRLRLIRKFFPGFLNRVIKRLQSADIDNPDLEEQMFMEDEYLNALIERDNKISFFKEKLENTIEKLDIAKEELGSTKEELGSTKEELGSTKEELGSTKEELNQEKVIANKLRQELAKTLKSMGVSIETIMIKTKLSRAVIEEL